MGNLEKNSLDKLTNEHEMLEFFQNIVDEYSYLEIINKHYSENVHSSFLAWLLKPDLSNNKDHGFKDSFLKRFLNEIQKKNNFDKMNFSDVEVKTESSVKTSDGKVRYDIILISKHNKLAVIIENKVFSKEGNQQLDNYFKTAQTIIPTNYTIFYIFLSPGGLPASDKKWLSISYYRIYEIINELLKNSNHNKFTPFIEQYLLTLRTWIIWDPEIDKIWKILYFKYKNPNKIISDYRNSIFTQIRMILTKLIEQNELVSNKKFEKIFYVKFISKKLLNSKIKKKLAEILIFEFRVDSSYHVKDAVELVLNICPPKEDEQLKKQLYRIAMNYPKLFIKPDDISNSKLTDPVAIYRRELFNLENYTNMHELQELLVTEFNTFIDNDFMKIINIFIENF